jgi:hypothetical protein
MTERPGLGRRGISLPLVILLMSLLALAVTVGFARVSDERRIVGDQQAQLDAFAVAQSGLERYFALTTTSPGAYDSVSIALGVRDTAFVVSWQVRAPAPGQEGIYLVRSRGVSHSARRYDASTPPAQRSVAQYATWRQDDIDIDAAWTALSGLRSQSNQGVLDGIDACGVTDTWGIAVPENLQVPPAQWPDGFGAPPDPTGVGGVPSIRLLDTWPTGAAAEVHVDWSTILAGGVLDSTYTLTGTMGWPLSFTDWPTIRVDGDVTVTGGQSGQGLLVVAGDLIMTSGFAWQGLILVGRRAIVQGTPFVEGAIISGLDVKVVGQTFPESNSGETPGVDQITLRYNSCHVASAMQRYARLVPIVNAWTDSWPEN